MAPELNCVNREDQTIMTSRLDGKKIALLVADGFEQIELTSPRTALEDAGAEAFIVSPGNDAVRGWQHTEWGDEFKVDLPIELARAEDFDALILPGGVMNPDKLRRGEHVRAFVRNFFEKHKPVAAICHGPWTLIDAGAVEGRRLTSYHSIRTDLENAGANWIDEAVVVDGNLITSRKPDDLNVFNTALIAQVAEGLPAGKRGPTSQT
jgi:protease I